MNTIRQDDLTPALQALREGLERKTVTCTASDSRLHLLCAKEAAFALYLVLEDPSALLPPELVWLDFSLQDGLLWIRAKEEEHRLSFSRAYCKIQLRDYARAPLSFDPHHYLRDRMIAILNALEEKHRLLPHTLTPKERQLLPLCSVDLFNNGALPPSARDLLRAYGVNHLPLREDESTLSLLFSLQDCFPCPPEEKQTALNERLARVFGPQGVFSFRPRQRYISVGLRSWFCHSKPLYCHLRAVSWEDRVILECALTSRSDLPSPSHCAVDANKLQAFLLFSLAAQQANEQTFLRLKAEIEALSFREFTSLQMRPRRKAGAVFLISSFLWAAISGALAGLVAPWIASPVLFLAPFAALLYGGARWMIYTISAKL